MLGGPLVTSRDPAQGPEISCSSASVAEGRPGTELLVNLGFLLLRGSPKRWVLK